MSSTPFYLYVPLR
ncbi:hypothetical protein V3C99_004454 [Haemonchus contortus]